MGLEKINWSEFTKIEFRVGEVIEVLEFPEARKPAWKLIIDFGDFGILKSSAQIKDHYSADDLLGKQVIAVINFPEKQIGPFVSQCLVTGFPDESGAIVLAVPEKRIPNGTKIC